MKREDYINWDEYFMGIALLTAMRSKDPNSQVGACIVSPENKILSLGYNGMPMGCSDERCPGSGGCPPADQVYVCLPRRAERHSQQRPQQPEGCPGVCDPVSLQRVHQGHHPVRHCEVVYYGDKYHDSDSSIAARFMFEHAGVRLTPYKPTGRRVELEL